MAPAELLCFNGCCYDKEKYNKENNIKIESKTR